jgi:hypothetical protein
MRSGWGSPADQCVIKFDGAHPELEATAQDVPLLAGAWLHELTVDGERISSTGEWTCVCWTADKDAAYLELQLNRDQPLQVIRQALLLREESLLLLGDSIRTPEGRRIEFERSIPLAGDWRTEEDSQSRELALMQGTARVRVFPLSAPQFRLQRGDETTAVRDGILSVRAHANASRMYVATLLDWSEKRRDEPVEWQRVTVAESMAPIGPETAAGFRIRIGKKQWVLYHSLSKPAMPRTALGIHSLSETVFSQLKTNGDLATVVEVAP